MTELKSQEEDMMFPHLGNDKSYHFWQLDTVKRSLASIDARISLGSSHDPREWLCYETRVAVQLQGKAQKLHAVMESIVRLATALEPWTFFRYSSIEIDFHEYEQGCRALGVLLAEVGGWLEDVELLRAALLWLNESDPFPSEKEAPADFAELMDLMGHVNYDLGSIERSTERLQLTLKQFQAAKAAYTKLGNETAVEQIEEDIESTENALKTGFEPQ